MPRFRNKTTKRRRSKNYNKTKRGCGPGFSKMSENPDTRSQKDKKMAYDELDDLIKMAGKSHGDKKFSKAAVAIRKIISDRKKTI
jgi:hypothetical protein